MPTPLQSDQYSAKDANLAGSTFCNVDLHEATFRDVNLRKSQFEDIAFTGATIRNASLEGVSIEDANYTGMRIDGILVTDLLQAYHKKNGLRARPGNPRPFGTSADSALRAGDMPEASGDSSSGTFARNYMTQYILLIQDNLKGDSTPEEWDVFFTAAQQSGLFKGGSEIGERMIIGDTQSATPTDHIVGFMRFDSDDKQRILDLLEKHPVVIHGGSVALCEMPKS